MKLCHSPAATSAVFDDPNLVSAAGLVPVMALAEKAGLAQLADAWLTVPTDKGANAGLKVCSLVADMVAGADSIADMGVLRHGGMKRVFGAVYAPSTLGSFLRVLTFGHVRQLDAVTSRFLTALGEHTPVVAGIDDYALVDVDDSVIAVYGGTKQGAGFGYTKVRGLNSAIATVSTPLAAPVIVAQRLRRGPAHSARGAARLVGDALAQVKKLRTPGTIGKILFRADAGYYGHPTINAATRAGADVSVTVRMDPQIRAAIAMIDPGSWTPIEYRNAIFDADTDQWISSAEVAEVGYTAFTSKGKAKQVPGRLVVRRIPELNPQAKAGQDPLFRLWRYHGFFTTSTLDTVTADKTHRAHAVIEQVHADLKDSALAHLPSASFAANSAWLVLAVIAFNLTRATATTASSRLAKATTGRIRRTLITVPARIATSARRITLHLPADWPWETDFATLFTRVCDPPRTP